jgi:hypothetical protein
MRKIAIALTIVGALAIGCTDSSRTGEILDASAEESVEASVEDVVTEAINEDVIEDTAPAASSSSFAAPAKSAK